MSLVRTERGPSGGGAGEGEGEDSVFHTPVLSPFGTRRRTLLMPSPIPTTPSQTPKQCTWNIVGGTQ